MMARLAELWLGREVEPEALRRDANGRPHLAEAPGLCLSAAERDGWTAAAIAGRPVGVDIDWATPSAPLPLDLLHPDEARALSAMSGAARARAFARLWTAKEAFAKAFSRPIDEALAMPSVNRRGSLTIDGGPVILHEVGDRVAAVALAR